MTRSPVTFVILSAQSTFFPLVCTSTRRAHLRGGVSCFEHKRLDIPTPRRICSAHRLSASSRVLQERQDRPGEWAPSTRVLQANVYSNQAIAYRPLRDRVDSIEILSRESHQGLAAEQNFPLRGQEVRTPAEMIGGRVSSYLARTGLISPPLETVEREPLANGACIENARGMPESIFRGRGRQPIWRIGPTPCYM